MEKQRQLFSGREQPLPAVLPTVCDRPKRAAAQGILFDNRGVDTSAGARYWVGDAVEQLTAEFVDGVQLMIDGQFDICPDIWVEREATYYECKAAGRSGMFILYDNRLIKDRDLINSTGRGLRYCVWRHTLSVNDAINSSNAVVDLQAALRRSVVAVAIVDFEPLESLCWSLPTKVLNTGYIKNGPNKGQRNGYGSKGYGRGWSLPFKRIAEFAVVTKEFDNE